MNSSNYIIQFGNSFIYLRIVLLIYSICLFITFHTEWFLAWQWIIAFLCLIMMSRVILNPNPYPHYLYLIRNSPFWDLETREKKTIRYNQVRIVMNVGAFFLLELRSQDSSKILIFFSDQITDSVFRFLKFNEHS